MQGRHSKRPKTAAKPLSQIGIPGQKDTQGGQGRQLKLGPHSFSARRLSVTRLSGPKLDKSGPNLWKVAQSMLKRPERCKGRLAVCSFPRDKEPNGFQKLPKQQRIAQSGHAGRRNQNIGCRANRDMNEAEPPINHHAIPLFGTSCCDSNFDLLKPPKKVQVIVSGKRKLNFGSTAWQDFGGKRSPNFLKKWPK